MSAIDPETDTVSTEIWAPLRDRVVTKEVSTQMNMKILIKRKNLKTLVIYDTECPISIVAY